jgi:hypothetical protein
MPPPRRKIKFESRQRALRRKYSLGTEIKRLEAFLENTGATSTSGFRSMQASTAAPSFHARSQVPRPATVSDVPGDTEIHNEAEPNEHSGSWEVTPTQVSTYLLTDTMLIGI